MHLKATNKIYNLEKSPLFGVKGLNQLKNILGHSLEEINVLLRNNNNYKVWTNAKGREIQEPVNSMKELHTRIGNLLSRIELPNYVHSKKQCSYITNAKQHIGSHPVIKTDIRHFFPSTTNQMICKMFQTTFNCSPDIAHCLAQICCFDNHLPTGSSISGSVAFFAAKTMFDDISKLADSHSCTLTVYVDDITLSGNNATKKLLSEVRGIIRRHGLRTVNKKSYCFAAHAKKDITGVIVDENGIKAPNRRHKKWRILKNSLAGCEDNADRQKIEQKLRGTKIEINQVSRQNNPK